MDKFGEFLEYLKENDIEKAVITKKETINYFLEKYPPNFSMLIFDSKKGTTALQVSKLDFEMAKEYKNKNLDIELYENFESTFKGCKGIEDTLPIRFLKFVKDYKLISKKIEEMREIKSKTEIENIKKAAKISDDAIEYATNFALENDNLTENQVAAEIEYFMKKNGSIRPSFDTISISDKKTRLPHGMPSNDIVKNILLMDIGALYEGYCSDITRTVILNENIKNYSEIYNIVNSVKKEAEKNLKAVISVKELDLIAREHMGEFKEYFIHSLGHGVGVEIHENPAISSKIKEDIILKEGMVITIEPGIYMDDFGVRIEDLYLVKKNGFEKLSNAKILEY
ncbi:peptidase M24 [Methanococcus maripaludis C5]|uniref:Peptidase M24 n=1 Tax=Methanococcus maripaludis (strain C5 / ATCC BAA-1333) TaxID=402880 RepID=A4FWX3_METM5|nr:M24 family metallopeptidase [Methanococcus maripaludis]ABO34702.1 peptidase M24 [Methanococcus maripaludis C5]